MGRPARQERVVKNCDDCPFLSVTSALKGDCTALKQPPQRYFHVEGEPSPDWCPLQRAPIIIRLVADDARTDVTEGELIEHIRLHPGCSATEVTRSVFKATGRGKSWTRARNRAYAMLRDMVDQQVIHAKVAINPTSRTKMFVYYVKGAG